MKHALTYLISGAVLSALGLYFGGWAYLLLWPAVACLLIGVAYAGAGAGIFGKRPDGSLPWWSWVLLLPYLAFTWSLWKLKRKISKETLYDEVAPGLWVGRRVLGSELPEGTGVVVDVTCEFAEPSSVLASCEEGQRPAGESGRRVDYFSLPTLNYSVPGREALVGLVEGLQSREGVYIHCAQGHGRSATVAAALLLRRGLAATADEAVGMVVSVRPKTHLEPCQVQLVNTLQTQSEMKP
jgi:protein-tyrosine phosphatase